MSKEENRRAMVIIGAKERGRTNKEIAQALGLSVRQVQRIKRKLNEQGPVGLAHGNRGTKPQHALANDVVEQVVELYKARYSGFNFSHFHEKLIEIEQLQISLSSVGRILKGNGYISPKKRRAPKHRSRRQRRACEGAMLQLDGSPHDWLEGRGPKMCLVGAIDDATGKVVGGVFREQEDAQGYYLLMRRIVSKYGIPESVYHDHHGIFERDSKENWSLEEELAGRAHPTQFGRLMEELGIRQIAANSPQAKGRIERLWATFQDRLVSELRLANACSMKDASIVLERVIIEHNKRFSRKPDDPKSVWRKLGSGIDWDSMFCFKYKRRVAKDNTISLFNTLLQIPPGPGAKGYSGCLVEVQQRFDGSLKAYYKGGCIARTDPASTTPSSIRVRSINGRYTEERPWCETKQVLPRKEDEAVSVEPKRRTPPKPAANHPWRRLAVTKSLTNQG